MTRDLRLAIVICSRDRPDFLAGALEAIDAVRGPDDEVVFVDSASREPRVRDVAAGFPQFTTVRCDEPGLARARNRGVAASSAPLIAFTDDDCRPQVGWPDSFETVFASSPRIGFVTGRVAADRDEGPVIAVGGAETPRTFEFGDDPADLGHGANFAVRREALAEIGGFDEALGVGTHFAGTEDHDAFWRILRAGWQGRYDPAALVVHHQWRTRRQYLRSQYGYGLGSGAFAVKAMRLDRPSGVRIMKDALWRRGAAAVVRDLRKGYETSAAANAVRLAGWIVGAVESRRLPVNGGRFL